MKTNRNIKSRYDALFCDGQTITSKNMTREQVMGINPRSFEYFLSPDFNIRAFRTAKDQWIEYSARDCPGLGDVCIRIIQALLLNPGEFLSPREISELTGRSTLADNNALSARLMAIREAHKESFKEQNFFLSRKAGGFGIAWNPTKSWCWIERITTTMNVSE